MKLCPQCAFIYEDDQSLCDMDGAELVHDAGSPSPERAIPPAKPERKFFATGAVAGVILLYSGFYVFTHRTASQNTSHSPSIVATEPQSAPNAILPPAAPTATPSPSKPPTAKVRALKSSPSRINKASPARPRPPTRKRQEQKSKPENTNATKESKVAENTNAKKKIGSILRKTGRLLKKPFKF